MEIRKICKTCLEEKELCEFPVHKDCIGGYSGGCKACKNFKCKEDSKRIQSEEKVLPKGGLKICCTCKVEQIIKNLSNKKDTVDGLMKRCKNCVSANYFKNKETISKQQKIYCEKNKKELSNYKNRWVRERREKDSSFKLKSNISPLIRSSFKRCLEGNYKKGKKTEGILNCTIEQFKIHIESQFLNWMSWDNYGNICGVNLEYNCSWDLDHILPLSSAKTEEELYLLNHWSNFQPLCSKVNRDEKRNILYPCTNLELNITII